MSIFDELDGTERKVYFYPSPSKRSWWRRLLRRPPKPSPYWFGTAHFNVDSGDDDGVTTLYITDERLSE